MDVGITVHGRRYEASTYWQLAEALFWIKCDAWFDARRDQRAVRRAA